MRGQELFHTTGAADNMLAPLTKTIKGGALGGALGIGLGLAGTAAMGIGYINRNERFINESPYVGSRRLNSDMTYGGKLYNSRNTSSQTAQDLNADGNIVLGMHNLRRGG
ncbi:hypothetical protein [Flavobacterium sp.]|uniref:hypothetical protein n=1 Tax=Flavobacterium sp. TaxID=239 RepID=UPI003BDB06BB